jgi:hypothetical protein
VTSRQPSRLLLGRWGRFRFNPKYKSNGGPGDKSRSAHMLVQRVGAVGMRGRKLHRPQSYQLDGLVDIDINLLSPEVGVTSPVAGIRDVATLILYVRLLGR